MQVVLLRFHIGSLEMIFRIDDYRLEQALWVGPRETSIAIWTPLHGRTHPIAIPKIDVVAHTDLIAVVDDRSTWQREQQPVHQLDLAAMITQQRSEPAPDAEINSSVTVGRISAIHVVTLLVGHHFESQLIMVTQK